jgi:thiamine transport system permease protein
MNLPGRPSGLPRVLLWIPAAAFVGLFFYLPLSAILRLVFDAAGGTAGKFPFSSAWNVFGFTVLQAVLSTLLTLLVGLPGAYLLARFDFPLKRVLRAFALVPFILPTVVVAAGFESLLGPNGWINTILRGNGGTAPPFPFLHTLGAILLAHVFYNTSIVLRLVGTAWERLDPRLSEAARVLGAGRWDAFRRVTLPLLLPAVWAAFALVFLFDFTSFGVILILGGPAFSTLETEIYFQALQVLNLPAAGLLCILQMASTLILIAISAHLSERAQAASSRVGFRTARRPGPPAEKAAVAAGGLVLFLFFFLPIASPAAQSFWRAEAARGDRTPVSREWTLEYYRGLFVDRKGSAFFATPIEMARNSLLVAAATAALALALGVPAAIGLARPGGFHRLLEPLLLLPLGTSAVALGLGMLVVFSGGPLDWIRSPAMLPVAHTLVAFPFVVRGLKPAFAGIPVRLREAAASLGAGPRRVFWTIDLPIAARAVVSSAAFAFAISLGEFGATAIIVRPDFPTLPVGIYRLLSQPGGANYGQAMALTTILMICCGAAVLLFDRESETARIA